MNLGWSRETEAIILLLISDVPSHITLLSVVLIFLPDQHAFNGGWECWITVETIRADGTFEFFRVDIKVLAF